MANRHWVRSSLSLFAAAALTLVSTPAWAYVEVEANRASAGANQRRPDLARP